jgi:hypothetical protein
MAKPVHKPETLAKVERICDLMRLWKYDAKARKQLAGEWKCTEDWVTDLAAEARDKVLGEYDAGQMKLDAAMVLRRMMLESMTSDDPKERRNAIAAAETLAKLTGANAAQKIDATVTGDDSQLMGRLAALLAEGEEGEDPLPAEPGRETSH